jgi:hypothetical protein
MNESCTEDTKETRRLPSSVQELSSGSSLLSSDGFSACAASDAFVRFRAIGFLRVSVSGIWKV